MYNLLSLQCIVFIVIIVIIVIIVMDHVFTCLHCHEPFVIYHKDFNCCILRHGVYKHNLQPIPPHATKEECDAFVRAGSIYGCAGPLQIVAASASYELVICDYLIQ